MFPGNELLSDTDREPAKAASGPGLVKGEWRMVINSHEPAKDRNKQNRENRRNRVKKVIDTGKEKGITLETPKTEEQKVSVKKEGDGAEAPKKKRILSAYIMHRMQVTAVRTERNRQERESLVHRVPLHSVRQPRHSQQLRQRQQSQPRVHRRQKLLRQSR